jgi:hypothetical protein
MKIAGGEKISNDTLYLLDKDLKQMPDDAKSALDVTAEKP